ncbi:hypothetical protein FWH13_00355 [Candidatus Saccharibacteria bacterium]|nr:hypothetical protein [Candidatus Saccharibacteria bacterium]
MHFIKNIGLVCTATCLAVLAVTSLAYPAGAQQTYIGLSPLRERLDLSVGGTSTGTFTVYNGSDHTQHYRIEINPFSIVDGGTTNNWTDQTPRNQIVRWTTLSEDDFTIESGGQKEITFTIQVPQDAPGGSQHASFFIYSVPERGEGSTGINETGGIRFILQGSIRDGRSREEGHLISQHFPRWQGSGSLTARAHVDNTGNLDFTATQSLEVKNLMGNTIWNSVPANQDVLAESERVMTHSWPETAFGIYRVSYNVHFLGEDHIRSHLVFLFPVWVIVLVILFLVAIILTIVHAVIKRRRNETFKKYV